MLHPACPIYAVRIPMRRNPVIEMGGSQKRCTKGGDRVRVCITHLFSITKINVGDFHVSVAINI